MTGCIDINANFTKKTLEILGKFISAVTYKSCLFYEPKLNFKINSFLILNITTLSLKEKVTESKECHDFSDVQWPE